MAARLMRIATSFGIVLTAYTVYALVAVPLIEPSDNGPSKVDTPAPAPVVVREDLAPYFPAGSWELKNPKVLESERAKLLIKDYKNLPDGRVKLFPCTVLFFGDDPPGAEVKAPPVILQAPEGAILKFDEPFDLKRAKIGRLIGGQLVGKVTIRRELSRPGAGDDLRITTRDIELSEDRVVSPHPVDFHFGPSYGSGRDMTIMLARNQKPGETSKGMGITGVKSFELLRDVRMHMLLGGKDPQKVVTGEPDNPPVRRAGEPPVEIACQGPFRFDLEHYVATFTEQVDVMRLSSNGPADQMNCELLTVMFARRDEQIKRDKSTSKVSKTAHGGPPSLAARLVEARGDPVVVRSPSSGAQARCQRLEYDVQTGRISLSGAGDLQGAMPRNPAQKYQARWSRELRYEPQAVEPMMSLVGGAHVKLSDVGGRPAAAQPAALSGDEIHLWFHPQPKSPSSRREATPAASIAFGGPTARDDIRPKRLLAQGAVRIDSVPLVGATGVLEVLFVQAAPAALTGAAAGETATRPRARQDAPGRQQFKVAGSQIRVQFAVRGEQTDISDVLLEGNAELRESKTARSGEKPLLAKGDRLQLVGGDSPDSQVNVVGKPAYIEARGLSLSGANIQLERRSNLLSINGPGRMTLPVSRDMRGQTLEKEQQLAIDWQASMRFDGRSAVFDRSVVARTAQQQLRTERLEATLKQAIDLSNPPTENRQSQPAQIDQIVCREGVFLESRTLDPRGVASIERMQALDLAINQTTGGIDAHGPGWVSSVRRGSPAGLLPQPATGTTPKPPIEKPDSAGASGADRLSYLGVNFARSITGNIHKRELTFADQVKTVYGPVANWEQKLDAENPESLGPEGITMNCDQLVVRDMGDRNTAQQPPAERGSLELEATGNTLVEGSTYTARAHRLTFAEKKSLLVLEGDGRTDAQLFRQPIPGGPTSQAAARRIMYWQSTNRVEIDDARFFDFGQFGLGPAKPNAKKPDAQKPAAQN